MNIIPKHMHWHNFCSCRLNARSRILRYIITIPSITRMVYDWPDARFWKWAIPVESHRVNEYGRSDDGSWQSSFWLYNRTRTSVTVLPSSMSWIVIVRFVYKILRSKIWLAIQIYIYIIYLLGEQFTTSFGRWLRKIYKYINTIRWIQWYLGLDDIL